MYKSPIRIQQHFILTFIIVLSIPLISGIGFSEPSWLNKPGIYINVFPDADFLEFDSKVKHSGCPAWGSWYNYSWGSFTNEKAIIDQYHSKGNVFVGSLTFNTMYEGDKDFLDLQDVAAIKLDGSYATRVHRISTNINSPKWVSSVKELMQSIIDAGADGIFFDDTLIDEDLCFDRYTLEAFTNYLKDKYTNEQLLGKYNISNIENFNYKDWIISNGQKNIWSSLPYDGLKNEFWIFNIKNTRSVLSELVSHIKNYAQENYQKDITVSLNASIDTNQFDVYADLIDYYVRETTIFKAKTAKAISSSPTPDWFTDYLSIKNKITSSMEQKINFPMVEINGVDVLGYPYNTKNLMKLIMADTFSTQSLPLLMSKIDGFNGGGDGGLLFEVASYDYDEIIAYAKFANQYPELFSTNTYYQPNCALLYSRSSHLLKTMMDTYSLPSYSFYGIGNFLINSSIPFDVIFAPDTRLNDVPDISISKLSLYETLILPNTINLNDNQVDTILEYVTNGGTVIALGKIGINGEDGQTNERSELKMLQETNGEKRYGNGRFISFYEERPFGNEGVDGYEYGAFYIEHPELIEDELKNFLQPYIDPEISLSNTNKVSGFIYNTTKAEDCYVIHLVNYDYDIPTDTFATKNDLNLTVDLDTSKNWEAVYISPDFSGPKVLPVTLNSNSGTVIVPELYAYGIVIIQTNSQTPQINGCSPKATNNNTIISGDTISLSVDVIDDDNNFLYYSWYIDGVLDKNVIGSVYELETDGSSSGRRSIKVDISDGKNVVTNSWEIDVQEYVPPKILFDETHEEQDTISWQKAQSMSPEHPDWVYLGILKSKIDSSGYVTKVLEEGELSSSILEEYNVLILSAPIKSLSSNEVDDIVSFVSNGGALFFMGGNQTDEKINDLLSNFGINFSPELIYKTGSDDENGDCCPDINTFIEHDALISNPIYKMIYGSSLIVTPPAVSLATSGSSFWRDTNYNSIQDTEEQSGPFTIIAAAEYGEGRVFCISNNAMWDSMLKWDISNADLFLGALSWLTKNVNVLNWYLDADQDGYGDPDSIVTSGSQLVGYVTNNTDCNDSDSSIHPGVTEIRGDSIDQDCNGSDLPPLFTYYQDEDGDGFGNPNNSLETETQPTGYVTDNTDCDDKDSSIYPGASELRGDGIDQDCNGNDLPPIIFYYQDSDGDSYGNPNYSTESETQPSGYVTDNGDCNDNDSSIHPGATENCNGGDDNCNGITDEACDAVPNKTTLTSPSGTTEDITSTFTWDEVLNATWYKLYLKNTSTDYKFVQWYEIADSSSNYPEVTCSSGECSITLDSYLESGSYEWFVMGWNDYGNGTWSDGMTFTIQGNESPPSRVTHSSPTGITQNSTPTFIWATDPASTWYKLWIGSPSGDRIFAQWYDAVDICSAGVCNVTTETELLDGDYEWYIKSWNDYGKIWSDGMSFTVSE